MNTENIYLDLLQYLSNEKYYAQVDFASKTLANDSNYHNKLRDLSALLGQIILIDTKISYIQSKLQELNQPNEVNNEQSNS